MHSLASLIGIFDFIQSNQGSIWVFNIAGFCFFYFIFKTTRGKGWFGEFALHYLGLNRLDKSQYTVISDFYVPRPDGKGTTQIDHVVVSKFGVFVIESKNYKGKIYGKYESSSWQQYIGKSKYPFQNPVRQNQLHIDALAKALDIPQEVFHNMIYFGGDCTLKNKELPPTVMTRGILTLIRTYKTELLDSATVDQITSTLHNAKATSNNRETRIAHIDAIHERNKQRGQNRTQRTENPKPAIGSPSPIIPNSAVMEDASSSVIESAPECPKCSDRMILRTATKGENKGNQFWGCRNYPKCRGVVTVEVSQ